MFCAVSSEHLFFQHNYHGPRAWGERAGGSARSGGLQQHRGGRCCPHGGLSQVQSWGWVLPLQGGVWGEHFFWTISFQSKQLWWFYATDNSDNLFRWVSITCARDFSTPQLETPMNGWFFYKLCNIFLLQTVQYFFVVRVVKWVI